MNVSRRTVVLISFFTILLSLGISMLEQWIYHGSNTHIPQIIGIAFVIIFIAFAVRLLRYQQELKRAKHNLDEAQQLAGLGSWERDLATGKGYWSDNHYRLFRLPHRTPAPAMEEFFEMIHADYRDQARETVMEAIRSSSSYEIRYRMADDADKRVFLSRGKVICDGGNGKPLTLVGSVQDITKRQRREDFRERLLKEKNLFIDRLGHDLKTPLTPLVALLPLIRSRTADQRQKELLGLCIEGTRHISDLVTKTLQLARFASSDLTTGFTDVPLSATAGSVISDMAGLILAHKLEINNSIAPEIIVRGNRTELEELFRELIRNAIKFSPRGSNVTMGASSSNGMITVLVQDNGIGLSTEELHHVFDDFYKADSSRHELGSSGLGLTICRRIVENHGGQIAASSPGRDAGAVISFTLRTGGSV